MAPWLSYGADNLNISLSAQFITYINNDRI